MWHVRRWDVQVNRATRSISLPGDGAMLAIIVATFAFEFALHYGVEARTGWMANPFAPTVAARTWGAFVGVSTGRNLDSARRYSAVR